MPGIFGLCALDEDGFGVLLHFLLEFEFTLEPALRGGSELFGLLLEVEEGWLTEFKRDGGAHRTPPVWRIKPGEYADAEARCVWLEGGDVVRDDGLYFAVSLELCVAPSALLSLVGIYLGLRPRLLCNGPLALKAKATSARKVA